MNTTVLCKDEVEGEGQVPWELTHSQSNAWCVFMVAAIEREKSVNQFEVVTWN